MKNTMKKYGFIALLMVAAVIAIGFTACEEPEDFDIWIEVDGEKLADGGYTYNGATLEFKHNSSDSISGVAWTKDGTPLTILVATTCDTSEADRGPGVYTVSEKSGKSFKVTVLNTASKNAPKYIGNWHMRAADNEEWQTVARYKDKNENLEITFTSFKIDSEVVSASKSPNLEYLYCTISSWEDVSIAGNGDFTKYGVKFNISATQEDGYFSSSTLPSSLYLFTNEAGEIRRFNSASSTAVNKNPPTQQRSYVRQ